MIELILNSGGKNILKRELHMVMCEQSFEPIHLKNFLVTIDLEI